ncbi:MAG: hypothetical protein A2152_03170, partial [Candidatus Levybacteria bacterium RBG_16_35_6]
MSKSLVSIIITTKNSSEFLERCLKSIKSQTYKNIELIVVDNNSIDDTKKIALNYTNLVFNKGPERSAQRNFGAFRSKGKYLLFIDSDMELTKNVVTDCVSKIQKHKALIIPEKSIGNTFWARCKALERSFYTGISWMEGARFFDKKIFKEFKGYDEKNTGTEDFDLPQKIEEKYSKKAIGRIESLIIHHEGNLSLRDTLKKKYYYGKKIGIYKSKNKNYFNRQ